jgi:hypothetical protein
LTFAHFIAPQHNLAGAPWYLAAAMLTVSLVIAWSVTRRGRQDSAGDNLAPAEGDAS